MKTEEEILSKHTGVEGIYLTKGEIRGSDALEAMEEYAKQFKEELKLREEQLQKLGYRVRELTDRLNEKTEEVEVLSKGWISVEEMMPAINDTVLAFGYDDMKTYDFANYINGKLQMFENKKVKITHWMPLPEPPKQ